MVIGSARVDENGTYANGTPGDQKQLTSPDYKGEVSLQDFYNHSKGWYVLRAKSIDVANKIAESMLRACNNKNVGYDQNGRLSILKDGTNSKVPTECDCSSLVRVCVKEATGKDPGNFNTDSERTALVKTGLFDFVGKYENGMTLYTGDILVTCSKGHSVVVVDGAKRRVEQVKPIVSTPNAKQIWTFLLNKGLPEAAVFGFMGNLQAESALKPKNLQNSYEKLLHFTDDTYTNAVDNGTYMNFVGDKAGYGLAQWTSSGRKQGLYDYAKKKSKSIGDLNMQLEYLWIELSTAYKSVLSGIKAAKTIREASDIVLTKFERPKDQSDSVKKLRASYGEKLFAEYKEKSITDVAQEVLDGKWGVGAERKRRLIQAGYDYSQVQSEVNRLLNN